MKVAIVIRRLAPSRGGAESWTAGLVTSLVDRAHDVHVFAEACEYDSRPVRFHAVESGGGSRAGKVVGFCERAAEAVAGQGFDVVHDQGDGWSANVFLPHGGVREAAVAHNLMSIPSAPARAFRRLSYRVQARYRALARVAERQFDPNAKREWVALSEFVRNRMIEQCGIPSDRIHLVYNGVDVERFNPGLRAEHRQRVRDELGVPDDQTLFLLVGHNFRLKGVRSLVQAAGLLAAQRQDFHVAVAGGGRVGPYERLARRLGCADQVRFVGHVPDARPYYAAADAYVHPTYYDPCSLVALEALASALPVVTTRFNGAGELLTEGADGYVVDTPEHVEALAERMARLLDALRRSDMGEAARRLAEQHSLERNHDEILAVYETARRRSPLD